MNHINHQSLTPEREEIHPERSRWDRMAMEISLRLESLQRRLGTPNEQPGDVRHAQDLAHELNNLRTAITLVDDLVDFRRTGG